MTEENRNTFNLLVKRSNGKWTFLIQEPIDISTHNPNALSIDITVRTPNQIVSGKRTPNGKMIVEPNENNYTDEFVNTPIGKIYIDKTGKQKMTFQAKGKQHLWLNSIWIAKIK